MATSTADRTESASPGFLGTWQSRVDRFQRRHPPIALIVAVVKKFGDDQAGNLAALVSYYLFFSLFPLLLALTTVLGFVLADRPDLRQQVVDSALADFPVIGQQIGSSVGPLTGSAVALVIGLVGALWAGMGAIGAMQNAMNTIWAVPMRERPNLLQERLRSFLMLLVLGAAVALSTALGAAGGTATDWGWIGRAPVLLASFVVDVGLFLLAFKVLTRRPLGWGQLLPGAIVAGVAFTILQSFGGVYVDHVVASAGPTYGTFAVVIGLLSWLFLQAQITVYAAELNVVRVRGLVPRTLFGEDLTTADAAALRSYADMQARHPHESIDVSLTADE
jgi:inner membrane protein YhjD